MSFKNTTNKKNKATWYFLGVPLTWETLLCVLFVIAVIVAISILADAVIVVKKGFWFDCSLGFLVFSALIYLMGKRDEIADKKHEIETLKAEIKRLERISKEDNEYIESLKTQLEKARNHSQEEQL